MTDSNYQYVVSLLHFNGPNNSTNFVEETGKTVTVFGDAKISTSQSKFNGSSAYFDGVGDYFTIPSIGIISTGNYTLECWIYPTVNSGTYKTIILLAGNSAGLYLKNDTILWYEATADRCVSASISMSVWHHVAVVRNGTTVDVYVDGVKSSSSYTSSKDITDGGVYVGCGLSAVEPYTGYIDDLRITKGIARYTANFTPPTTEFWSQDYYWSFVTLLCHFDGANNSTTIVDEVGSTITTYGNAKISTTQSQFGGSSGYFDGTNSYLASNLTPIDNQSYTIECWIYPTSYSSDASWGRYIYSQYDNTADFANRFLFGFPENNSHKLQVYHASGGGSLLSTSDISLNTWTHVATTYDGSTRRLFVNGVLEASVATSSASLSYSAARIGCVYYNNYLGFFAGYIDELRITKGVARYVANFAVPVQAFSFVGKIYNLFEDYLTIAPSAFANYASGKVIKDAVIISASAYDGGTFSVSGTVTYNGVPAARKVGLFTLKDKRLIAETWSDPATGAYSFTRLKDQEYFVWSEDYLRVFDPVSHLVANQ